MSRQWITEASVAVITTSGVQVAQSIYSGGIGEINALATGTLAAGIFTLIQRYRQKAEKK